MDTDLADWLDHADEDTRTELAHVWIEEQVRFEGPDTGLLHMFLREALVGDGGGDANDGELVSLLGYNTFWCATGMGPHSKATGEAFFRTAMKHFVAFLADDAWTEFRAAILDTPPDIVEQWMKDDAADAEEARRDDEQATRESMAGVAEACNRRVG